MLVRAATSGGAGNAYQSHMTALDNNLDAVRTFSTVDAVCSGLRAYPRPVRNHLQL